jgi:hypothetical protein
MSFLQHFQAAPVPAFEYGPLVLSRYECRFANAIVKSYQETRRGEQTKKEQGSFDPCSGYLNRFETARLEHKRALRRRTTGKEVRGKIRRRQHSGDHHY